MVTTAKKGSLVCIKHHHKTSNIIIYPHKPHFSCIYQSVDCKTYFIIACTLIFSQLDRVIFCVNVTGAGFSNVRIKKNSKNGSTTLLVCIQVNAEHWVVDSTLDHGPKSFCKFQLHIAALNPYASTTFSKDVKLTADNLTKLERYLRTYPIRMRQDGYDVDNKTLAICKAMRPQA